MKSRKNLLEKLKKLPYFSNDNVHHLGEQLDLRRTTVDTYISRFLRKNDIISLKKGLYVSADFYLKNKGYVSYLFYLANVLRRPSYISSWTALQYYNLATEVIHSIISVTPKVTRSYKTKIGTFTYQSVKKTLFSDFSLIKNDNGFDFFIASPSKALFDLLYFKTSQFKGMKINEVDLLIDELRIDIGEIDRQERKKFYVMVKEYISHE